MISTPWLVFTDLDGTLLDHHTYSFAEAQPALSRLAELGIPVIINSSKTLAEIADIRAALDLDAPVIAENGSLISTADAPVHILGERYDAICQHLQEVRESEGFQFAGFNDWSVAEVGAATGLDEESAAKAKQRQASEPIVWSDTDARMEAFQALMRERGLTVKRGGRFWHIMGQTDKVVAMQVLARNYADAQRTPRILALGDGPNDVDMLSAADIAVVVHNPDGRPIEIQARPEQQVIYTELAGPTGWNQAILQLMSQAALLKYPA